MKPSELVHSVYEFLVACGLTKSAKALKKEAELGGATPPGELVPLMEAAEVWERKKKRKASVREEEPAKAKKAKKAPPATEVGAAKKKRKRPAEEATAEDRTAAAAKAAEEWMAKQAAAPTPKVKTPREAGKPFSRLDDGEWLEAIVDDKLKDNSYEGTYGDGGYGAKASQKLIQVRGKQFRHEKTKKKRSNYRGGTIDLGSNSIKFDT